MPVPVIPSRFRRRLTAAFILVAVVTSGALSLGSYVLIREYRYHNFAEQAEDQAQLSLLSAPSDISLTEFEEILAEYERRAGFETVAVTDEAVFSSSSELGAEDVPTELGEELEPGRTRQATTTVKERPFLVVAGIPVSSRSTRLYFFFSQEATAQSVREARNVLGAGCVVAILSAALFGTQVARRTLRPVREAAGAARALAEGLLDTRLQPRSDDEFGVWAHSFNGMAHALEEKIAELSRAAARERRFTASVAHELRTPLTGMTSAASLLEEELDVIPAGARRPAELLIDDVRRLEDLVLELLELARLDAGREIVDLEPLSVSEAVGAVLRSWDGASPISAEVNDGLFVLADRARFKRVLANLVANAVQHGGGDVQVRSRQDADCVEIDVLDRGPGIDEGDLPHLFDRFFKADPARAGGAGLGLSIALENAHLQNGTIKAANREGGGARFTLRLPAVAASAGPEAPAGDSRRP